MKRPRTWQIHISNIKFHNDYERKDPFLRINVGWDFQPLKVYKQGPRKQDKDGKLLPRESEIRAFGGVGAEFVTEYVKNIEKGETPNESADRLIIKEQIRRKSLYNSWIKSLNK